MNEDDFLDELKEAIKERTLQQMKRHQGVDPNISLENIVDIQLRQEHEFLLKKGEEFERDGHDSWSEACYKLAEEWLPQLRVELLRL